MGRPDVNAADGGATGGAAAWETLRLGADAVRSAARRPDVVAAMEAFFAELDAEIAARRPACVNRGLCCRFDEYGHRLYVTSLEAAYFWSRHGAPPEGGAAGGCPFQRDGLCTAREGRPMGCRVFFCDPATQAWQGPTTERRLERLRRLHEELGVPYVYAEWRAMLAALASSP